MDKNEFIPGKDRVLFGKAVYGEEEIEAVVKALREGWLGHGKYVAEFEKKVADLFGKKYGLFVNSGTSANILALEIANLPKGSEVITQACTFPATLAPIVRLGLVPVFVDSKIGTYNIDIDQVEKAISDKTSAIFISHAIGNVNDMERLREIADKHDLVLIEDSCDTIGCKFEDQPTGTYSDIVTTSFYAAHNMTSGGGGGMVLVDDEELIREARMLNDWGSAWPTSDDKNFKERLSKKVDGIDFDTKFTYERASYNFKGVEMQAAFGLAQLKKLPKFNAVRAKNFKYLEDYFKKHEQYFYLPEIHPQAEAYLIAFPLTVKPEAPFSRKDLTEFLEERNIQTRPLFSGNILRHPAYRDIRRRVHGDLKNSDYIMENSLLIGTHHGLTDQMLEYVMNIFDEYIKHKAN